jgi:hypothetical protein
MEALCFMEFEQEAMEENREGKAEKVGVEEILTRFCSGGRKQVKCKVNPVTGREGQ